MFVYALGEREGRARKQRAFDEEGKRNLITSDSPHHFSVHPFSVFGVRAKFYSILFYSILIVSLCHVDTLCVSSSYDAIGRYERFASDSRKILEAGGVWEATKDQQEGSSARSGSSSKDIDGDLIEIHDGAKKAQSAAGAEKTKKQNRHAHWWAKKEGIPEYKRGKHLESQVCAHYTLPLLQRVYKLYKADFDYFGCVLACVHSVNFKRALTFQWLMRQAVDPRVMDSFKMKWCFAARLMDGLNLSGCLRLPLVHLEHATCLLILFAFFILSFFHFSFFCRFHRYRIENWTEKCKGPWAGKPDAVNSNTEEDEYADDDDGAAEHHEKALAKAKLKNKKAKAKKSWFFWS